jgi:hypothetical protein
VRSQRFLRAFLWVAAAAALLLSCSGEDEGGSLREHLDATSSALSLRIREETTMTIDGHSTETMWREIEYEAPDKFRFTSSRDDWGPRSAVIIGERIWQVGGWPNLSKDFLLSPYLQIQQLEKTLASGGYRYISEGPLISGEPTSRYRSERNDVFEASTEALQRLGTPAAGRPSLESSDIQETLRIQESVDMTIEILIGAQSGRIYSIQQDTRGPNMSMQVTQTFADFDVPFGITAPAGPPTGR